MADFPKGYFDKVLAVDVETSGMNKSANTRDDPSYDSTTGETYQIVSIGLIVASAKTLLPIKELYIEIKWDGVSKWDEKAQAVHGLSLSHLEANGVDSAEAVAEIANLIVDYWGPDPRVILLGQNVASFDLWFLKRLLRSEGIELPWGNRHIDSFSAGFATLGTFDSDALFEQTGSPVRDDHKHNALDDARMSLTAVRMIRKLFTSCVEG